MYTDMENDDFKKRGKYLTIKQRKFLIYYSDTLNLREAAKKAGLRSDSLNLMLRKKTLFTDMVREIQKNVINDPRFTKAGSIGELQKLKDEARSVGDLKLVLDIQKEINKMIDGNLAVQKVLNERTERINIAVIDLTKKEPAAQLEETNPIDTDYEEMD